MFSMLWSWLLIGAVLSANCMQRLLFALCDPGAQAELLANVSMPVAQFTTGTTTTTFAAGQLTGAAHTIYANTGATPGSIATRTAAQMLADFTNAQVGQSYMLTITNAQGTGTLTITGGTGVTITGTATIAVNTSRRYIVTFNTATTITMQNVDAPAFS